MLFTSSKFQSGSGGIAVLYRNCDSVQAVRCIGGVEVYMYCTGTEALYRPVGTMRNRNLAVLYRKFDPAQSVWPRDGRVLALLYRHGGSVEAVRSIWEIEV